MGAMITGMVAISMLFGLATGQGGAVSTAALEGAKSGVTLCISMTGAICLWSGVMEVMERSGLAAGLSRMLRPVLKLLYPRVDGETMNCISANLSANLLGLGNAATPLGVEAARRLSRGGDGAANHSLCLLVVCNTASVQLIPTTVAALRSGLGSGTPFDILPAVWLASVISVTVGICVCQLLGRIWRD